MPFDPRQFRDTLGCFATGVTVVTSVDAAARPFGVTVNSFTSVSLDPPLILVCLGLTTIGLDALGADHPFVVNILDESDEAVSTRFATRDRQADWTGVAVAPDAWHGCPRLAGGLAHLDCRLSRRIDAGDHAILLGAVEGLARHPDRRPLLYLRGRYARLAET